MPGTVRQRPQILWGMALRVVGRARRRPSGGDAAQGAGGTLVSVDMNSARCEGRRVTCVAYVFVVLKVVQCVCMCALRRWCVESCKRGLRRSCAIFVCEASFRRCQTAVRCQLLDPSLWPSDSFSR